MTTRTPSLSLLSALLIAAPLVACDGGGDKSGTDSDSDASGDTSDTSDTSDTNDTSDTDGSTVPAVFGVVSVPDAVEGVTTSYLILADSLTEEFKLEDASVEINGRAVAGVLPGADQVFVGSSASAEVTRYDYANGTLTESGKVSFAGQQVTGLAGYSSQLQFVDADTAYWFDRSGRIVVWNPTAMTAASSIVLADMIREDPDNTGTNLTTAFTGAPIWHGDELISFVSWDSRNAGVITIPGAYGVIVVDTTNDTAQFYTDDAGCGYGRDGVIDGDWLYIATEAVGTSIHHLDEDNGPAPCLRRFNLDTKTFDSTFKVDLNDLAGGPAGSLVTSASGDALIHVLDTDEADPLIEDGTISNPRVLSSGDLWKTFSLTVGDTPVATDLEEPLRSASTLPVTLLNGLRVTPTFGDNPQILEVTADGVVETSATGGAVTGFTASVFQIH